MALTDSELSSLDNLHGLPLGKILCIAKAGYKAYKCISAAHGNTASIEACATTLVADFEACIKG